MTSETPRTRRYVLAIGNMRTVHCVRAVTQALAGVPGAHAADVAMGRAELETTASVDRAAVASCLDVVGYALLDFDEVRRLPLMESREQDAG